MQTLESVRRKIQTAEVLYGVVRTMRTLAATTIRQHEKLVDALVAYEQTIELGLQLALQAHPGLPIEEGSTRAGHSVGALVFGSDQGLCGRFNERIVTHMFETLNGLHVPRAQRRIAVVGMRSAALIGESGHTLAAVHPTPAGIAGITEVMHTVLGVLEHWRMQEGIEQILLFYNQSQSGGAFRPRTVNMLPLDSAWLAELRDRPWPTRVLPTCHIEWDALFSALVRQTMFVTLYRACAESMSSEEASRLVAMQNAERNIEDRLTELSRTYQQQRQASIQSELLEISAGYEAVASFHHL